MIEIDGRIIKSWFNDTTGVSYVQKQSKYGTFEAFTRCHIEDEDIANQWDGCSFAEYQCDLQILKAKRKAMRQRVLGMEQVRALLPEDCPEEIKKEVDDFIYSVRKQVRQETELLNKMSNKYVEFTDKVLKHRRELREKFSTKKE